MVNILSSPPFYTNHVILPNGNDPIPPEIQQNPIFWPTSKVHCVPLMDVTLTLQPLHHSWIYTETKRCYITKLPLFLLIWSSIFLYSHWIGRQLKHKDTTVYIRGLTVVEFILDLIGKTSPDL